MPETSQSSGKVTQARNNAFKELWPKSGLHSDYSRYSESKKQHSVETYDYSLPPHTQKKGGS